MKYLICVSLVLLVLLVGCYADNSDETSLYTEEQKYVRYIYDEVHEVGIWIYHKDYAGGIAVLPASKIANPRALLDWRK